MSDIRVWEKWWILERGDDSKNLMLWEYYADETKGGWDGIH